MWDTILKIRDLLTPHERRRMLLLLGMILVLGFVESSRVASVLPFVAVAANPEVVASNPYLSAVYDWFGFTSTNQFLAVLGIALFFVFIFSLLLSAVAQYATLRFTNARQYQFSKRLFEGYLDRPYEWFLTHNSSDLVRGALSEVAQVVNGALTPLLQLATQGVVALALIITLVVVDPVLAVIVTLVIAGGYVLIYTVSRRYLSRVGKERYDLNAERFRIATEAFSGIKDVKVLALEGMFRQRFDVAGRRTRAVEIASNLIGQIPYFGMQALAFGLVLGIVVYLLYVRGSIASALPIIALYALAGQRLLPALQQVYQAATRLRYAGSALDALHRDLKETQRFEAERVQAQPGDKRLVLREGVDLSGVTYSYAGADRSALRDVSLSIPARGMVGFVGQTGAGKTTVVDVILGLLQPQAGTLSVDGVPITAANRAQWLAAVGYVPQSIFLSDDTVAANIAFGVPAASIDLAAVHRAAEAANLHEFVERELPLGYSTLIGERGVRLSGGQRQRVGIARALYRDPDLLIMDEGTSALDNVTERAVMDAIHNLGQLKTVVLVAHRLSTVRDCSRIFLLDRGVLVAAGTYDELARTDERFRAMAGAARA